MPSIPNQDFPNNMAVIVPSHISNASRIKLLMTCLDSLLNQVEPTPVYLSISFDAYYLQTIFEKSLKRIYRNNFPELLSIYYRPSKTPQFIHIEKTYELIHEKYDWFLFCDDDDTYKTQRTLVFKFIIFKCITQNSLQKPWAGLYELCDNIPLTAKNQTYEYWSFCVHKNILADFFSKIRRNHGDVLNHTFCDLVFTNYLKQLTDKFTFYPIEQNNYNYITYNNSSITNSIRSKNEKIKNSTIEFASVSELITTLNEEYKKNMDDLLNNVMIYTLHKLDFDNVLKIILRNHYNYKENIDPEIINALEKQHDKIKSLCDDIYDA
jgi:hypothetical protein